MFTFKKFLFTFLMVFSYCSYGQQITQTPKDIYAICQNDNEFLGKPLHILLSVINPSIKMVSVEGGWRERSPHIQFFFMTRDRYQDCINKKKIPIRLTVFLKDIFEWSKEKRAIAHFWEWTKQDGENIGQNIITYIRVSGDCDTYENENSHSLLTDKSGS